MTKPRIKMTSTEKANAKPGTETGTEKPRADKPRTGKPGTARPRTGRFGALLQSLVLSLLIAGSAWAAEKVNINTADAATIDRVLLNIGPSKAEAIVAYRKANGPFKSADQLALVKGVGLKTIEKNRERIVVSGTGAAAPARAAKTAAKR